MNKAPLRARQAVDELRQDLVDAKKYAQDYELSETREEQVANARKANSWLDKAHRAILKASEFNVFGPIDIAHISAQIDQVKADLK